MSPQNVNVFIFPLSFASGLSKGITVISTGFWLKSCGSSYTNLGIFHLVSLSSSICILWVPIFDKIDLAAILGKCGIRFNQSIQRKGLIVISSILCGISILVASLIDPKNHLGYFASMIGLSVFWLSNSDAVATAYTHETLKPEHMGVSTAAYRIGIFTAGTLTLYLYEKFHVPWSSMYQFAAILIIVLNLSVIFAPKEKTIKIRTWRDAFILPYEKLVQKYGFNLVYIFLLMVFFKLEDRFVAPMEQNFLRDCCANIEQFTLLKLISTFALAFAAVKSSPLISRFGYRKTFIISILAALILVLCYLLCAFKNQYTYILCLLIASLLVTLFYRLCNSKIPHWVVVISSLSIPIIASLVGVPLNLVALFSLAVIAKMISGIRSSLLYTYQCALVSREHALSQVTIIQGGERLFGYLASPFSGMSVDRYGWIGFYSISLLMACTPFLVIRSAPYPANNREKKPAA